MCGIVYAHDFTGAPVNNGIMQQFDNQRSRGTQGFGLFDGQEMHIAKAASEDKILKWLVKYDSNLIMFHHRWPTSTINVKQAAHPFATKKYFGDNQYILVHNGIITNAWELVDDHEQLGISYQSELQDGTFNDSESLLWDVALYLEGKQTELKTTGQVAFVCIKLHKGKLDKLFFGRNNNPLNMYRDKHGIALSSEGNGEPIEPHTLYTWNYELKRLTTKPLRIPSFAAYVASTANNYMGYQGTGRWDKWGDDDEYSYSPPKGCLPVPYKSPQTEFKLEDKLYEPDVAQVQARALHYLMARDGVFELAYEDAEDDYDQILDDTETYEEYKEIRLIERVLEFFATDPEYEDEYSVSSLWETVWTSENLTS